VLPASGKEIISLFTGLNLVAVVPCFYVYSQKAQSPSDLTAVCASYSSLSIRGIERPPKDDDEDETWEG